MYPGAWKIWLDNFGYHLRADTLTLQHLRLWPQMLSKLLTSKAGTLWFQAISFDRKKMSDFGGQIIFHYEKCILDVINIRKLCMHFQ